MNRQLLLDRICTAFPAIPAPSPSDILYNETPDYKGSYPVDEELAEMKCFFGNRRWDLLKPNDVFNFRHALSFFSELALSYYSAAWMTCAVLNEDAVDTAIEDLVGILQEADPKLWTSDQRDVIQDWLSYFRERFNETFSEEVDAALRNIRRSHSC